MFVRELELQVQDSEIDELGHVNNARFLEYFERGRMDWYSQCDPALNNIDENGPGTVVVNIDINYRRECFAGDRLVVVTRPETRGGKSYRLYQEILDEHGNCVSDARVTSVVMDMSTRETVAIPDALARQFSRTIQGEKP